MQTIKIKFHRISAVVRPPDASCDNTALCTVKSKSLKREDAENVKQENEELKKYLN